MSRPRPDGFYWVKFDSMWGPNWRVEHYEFPEGWHSDWHSGWVQDDYWLEVGPHLAPPSPPPTKPDWWKP